MKRILPATVAIGWCLFLSSCQSKKPDAVVILSDGGANFYIQPEVFFGKDNAKGRGGVTMKVPSNTLEETARNNPVLSSVMKAPGTIFVYRTSMTTANGEKREAGRAYRLNDKGKLDDAGKVDLYKSDQEIAKQFGVE